MTVKPKTGPKGAIPDGDPHAQWHLLFDPGERESLETAIDHSFYWVSNGHEPDVYADNIEELVCRPLEAYIKQTRQGVPRGTVLENVRAAVNLNLVLYDICEALTARKTLPARVEMLKNELKRRWDDFIIAGAAYRIYIDLPKDATRRKKQGAGGKKGALERQKIDLIDLKIKHDALVANGTSGRDVAGKLAIKFRVTADAIRKALKKTIAK